MPLRKLKQQQRPRELSAVHLCPPKFETLPPTDLVEDFTKKQDEPLIPLAMVFAAGAKTAFLESTPTVLRPVDVLQYHNNVKLSRPSVFPDSPFLKVDAAKEEYLGKLLPMMLLCAERYAGEAFQWKWQRQ